MNKILLLLLVTIVVIAGTYIYVTGRFTSGGRANPISIIKEEQMNKTMKLKIFAENLTIPWSMVFTSDKRMLVTERTGTVRVINDGVLDAHPLHEFAEAKTVGEAGLMGMTKDPEYMQNKLLYFCLAYEKNKKLMNKVVRAIDDGSMLTQVDTIIDDIPAAQYHAGCRIAFGPDKKLYMTTGDAAEKGLAQDKTSLAGKILRYNADGSIPSDNPFAKSAIFSIGHRNPQGIDWHPGTGTLFSTEHGPSGFDGPGGGDEINAIQPGGNYGWPVVSHERSAEGMIDPLYVMTPAEAPASGMFYRGDMFPEWKNSFFFGALKGEGLIRATFDNGGSIDKVEKLFHEDYGRIRDVIEGPDGSLYFSTSNKDGRGDVNEGDDKIMSIFKE